MRDSSPDTPLSEYNHLLLENSESITTTSKKRLYIILQ